MNRIDKLNSLASSIVNPMRSKDIRLTAAVYYALSLKGLEDLPHPEMVSLTFTFGTHLPHLLEVATDTLTFPKLREMILEEAVGKSVMHFSNGACIQEDAMFRAAEPRGSFTYAASSIQQSVFEWIDFGTALHTLEKMSRNFGEPISDTPGEHTRVLNAAKRLHTQIDTACVQYFPDSRKTFGSGSSNASLPPATPPQVRGLGSNLR